MVTHFSKARDEVKYVHEFAPFRTGVAHLNWVECQKEVKHFLPQATRWAKCFRNVLLTPGPSDGVDLCKENVEVGKRVIGWIEKLADLLERLDEHRHEAYF